MHTLALLCSIAGTFSIAPLAQEPAGDLAARAQGEYELVIEALPTKPRIGAQVVSRGASAFELVLWPGGLPGDGGQRAGREVLRGSAESGAIRFPHERGEITWRDGQLSGRMNGWNAPLVFAPRARVSPTLGSPPPKGATRLFGPKENDFVESGDETAHVDAEGNLEQGATSRTLHGDALVHVEFLTPFEPVDEGQGRGNSGVYLQGRYEVQVLDSFGLEGKHDECGGIYGFRPPDSNPCLPPGSWQTYDIEFRAPRFDASGQKQTPARLTVYLNGVKIHEDAACPEATVAAPVAESPAPGPLYVQDHGDAVRYRNVWILPRG